MKLYVYVWINLFATLSASCSCTVLNKQTEPECYSRWDYEYRNMEKLLKLESQGDELSEASNKMKHDVVRIGNEFEILQSKGYTAGKRHNQGGSGSDTICLPEQPTWRRFQDGNSGCCRGYIYGKEIDIEEPSNTFIYPVNNQNMPCAVCLTPHTATLMIPAQTECPSGWTKEFDGFLMSAYHSHPGPHNHICVDIEPEFVPNGGGNEDEHILYLMEAQCGSLPCPPYVHGRELACVVCSI